MITGQSMDLCITCTEVNQLKAGKAGTGCLILQDAVVVDYKQKVIFLSGYGGRTPLLLMKKQLTYNTKHTII